MRSPWKELAETPRQPRAAEGVRGTIELLPGHGYEDAIADLDGWDYVWVIFWFHRTLHYRPKVTPPRSERKRGVLSTRSPHRPNPIGLSVLRLVERQKRALVVEDLDLVDGTPVLDVKPYVPWTDAIPHAKTGWLTPPEGALPGGERPADPRPIWPVHFEPLAQEQLAWLRTQEVTPLDLDLEGRLRQALSLGPQAHAYRRIKKDEDGLRIAVKEWYARFRADDSTIVVERLEPGRRDGQDGPLELAFRAAFPRR